MALSFTDLQPGDFAQASIDGGLPRLVRIWEHLRTLNKGGYGSAVLVQLGQFTKASKDGVTSCSPFTATALCMALDPRPFDPSGPYSLQGPYKPVFDGGTPVDHYFYALHNGFELKNYKSGKAWNADFRKYVDKVPQLTTGGFSLINSAPGSAVALNMGTPVDPKQMRRGDLLGWDWNPKTVTGKDGKKVEVVHGHAAFCWNVHLDAKGEVDCFQFVTSNGGYTGDIGISVCTYYGGKTYDPEYIEKKDGKYTPKKDLFSGIVDDPQGHPDYISRAVWFALPGVKAANIDKSSFGGKKPVIFDSTGGFYVNHFTGVTRLHGVTPPEPYLRADGAPGDDKPPAQPVGKAVSKPADVNPAPAKPPEKAPPGPAQGFQNDVEAALQILYTARWIETSPGDASSVNDAESQAAIKEYQQKFMGGNAPHLGHADAETRKRILRASGYALCMPMVNASLNVLFAHELIAAKPGDDAVQLDEATREAVKDFQGRYKLDADGIPGPNTQKKLAEVVKSLGDAPPPPTDGDTSPDGPAAGAAAITLFYWLTNVGPAGGSATLKATATPACNGQSFPVSLYANGSKFLDNAGSVTIAGGKGSLDVALPIMLAEGALVEARIEGFSIQAKTKSPYRIGVAAASGPIAVVNGGDVYLDPPLRNLPQFDDRWRNDPVAVKGSQKFNWWFNGCNASSAAMILRWFAEDCKAGRIPFPTKPGSGIDAARYGPRMAEAFWPDADPPGTVALTPGVHIDFLKLYGIASGYLKTAGQIDRGKSQATYIGKEPKTGWLETIKEMLKTGPVIVGIDPPTRGTGHFVVAHGVVDGALLVADPGNILYQAAHGGSKAVYDWSNRDGYLDGTTDAAKARMPAAAQWPNGKAPGYERDARGYNRIGGQFLKEMLAGLRSLTSLTYPGGPKLAGTGAPAAQPAATDPKPKTPASKGKVKSGDIRVAGKPFAEWFNGEFHPKHKGNHSTIKVKGASVPEFPHTVNAANFKAFFDATKQLSGEDEISLMKFAGAFCIPYNETGGSFHPTLEKGGKVALPRGAKKTKLVDFGPYGYFFWTIAGFKKSYNRRDKWTWPAGDQLKKMGLLSDPGQIGIWNGAPVWQVGDPVGDPNYPSPLADPRYPNPQDEPLKSAQKECHFYKFRGRGFTQTTGREGYLNYAESALKAAGYKGVDDLTNDELDQAFADPKVYVAVFHDELIAPPGRYHDDFANIDDNPGVLVRIGDRLAGFGANYGEFYAWRCRTLAEAMEEAGWTGG